MHRRKRRIVPELSRPTNQRLANLGLTVSEMCARQEGSLDRLTTILEAIIESRRTGRINLDFDVLKWALKQFEESRSRILEDLANYLHSELDVVCANQSLATDATLKIGNLIYNFTKHMNSTGQKKSRRASIFFWKAIDALREVQQETSAVPN